MSIKEKLMLKGLNIALKVSPDNINLLYDRAFYNLGLNLVDKALEDVDRILDIVTSYETLSAKLYLLMILKRYEEALECYNELKAMNPEFEDDLLVLNEIYMWLEMYKEHLPVLDKLLLIEKDNLFYLFYRARTSIFIAKGPSQTTFTFSPSLKRPRFLMIWIDARRHWKHMMRYWKSTATTIKL